MVISRPASYFSAVYASRTRPTNGITCKPSSAKYRVSPGRTIRTTYTTAKATAASAYAMARVPSSSGRVAGTGRTAGGLLSSTGTGSTAGHSSPAGTG